MSAHVSRICPEPSESVVLAHGNAAKWRMSGDTSCGMSHDSNKWASLGMVSTATRTTATVSPLGPLTNGSALAQSANSGFAAALRKLAKQAEDPRGSAVSAEPSPVSSPAAGRGSPVGAPKQAPLGPQSRGHAVVPGAPPVVTIAPTKTSNGLWRADGRQVEPSVPRLAGVRERASADDARPPQDKRTPPVAPPHPLAHPFGLTPNSVMQDPRMQSLSLPGQTHPTVPSGTIPEEYLRALRPFAAADDPRLTSVPLGLDAAAAHAAAAAAAAYYHSAYLHHPLSLPRMEESLCLSALRSQFYSVPAGGAFPPLHPSGLHLHLPGGRYPGELNHGLLAERLQMENELRQKEREEEREREMDRLKERQRDRQQQMARAAAAAAAEGHGSSQGVREPVFPGAQISSLQRALLQGLRPAPRAQPGAFSPGQAPRRAGLGRRDSGGLDERRHENGPPAARQQRSPPFPGRPPSSHLPQTPADHPMEPRLFRGAPEALAAESPPSLPDQGRATPPGLGGEDGGGPREEAGGPRERLPLRQGRAGTPGPPEAPRRRPAPEAVGAPVGPRRPPGAAEGRRAGVRRGAPATPATPQQAGPGGEGEEGGPRRRLLLRRERVVRRERRGGGESPSEEGDGATAPQARHLLRESALPAHVRPGHLGPPRRAAAAQEEEEEADDEGAQRLAAGPAREEEVPPFAGRRADDAVQRRADGRRPRAAGEERLPAGLEALPRQRSATQRQREDRRAAEVHREEDCDVGHAPIPLSTSEQQQQQQPPRRPPPSWGVPSTERTSLSRLAPAFAQSQAAPPRRRPRAAAAAAAALGAAPRQSGTGAAASAAAQRPPEKGGRGERSRAALGEPHARGLRAALPSRRAAVHATQSVKVGEG
ncbi:genetic suppressor element 1-like isoform X5 [Syngnathoides biaculeatus]|uniref:genetic suppressor element 1-like isoform X5 n=1 Tax=Syngnathoides biaculeatus TaxID=300417 RepID=UPI002ADDDE5D|nr:genetic suppressor element 1-like isoform X5 [Syngnathoides biaculeatus]